MKKSLIIAGVIIVVGVAGCGVYIFRDTLFKTSSPTVLQTVQETKEEMISWDDPAGFSFQYPKGIEINKHDEDTENYAHLELTNKTHTGRLIIWAKDTTYGDVAAWVTKDTTLKNAAVIDTILGGKPAKKIILVGSTKKFITGAIDEQILFTVEAEPTEGDAFWQKTYDTIVQSFAFVPVGGNDTGTMSTVEDSGPVVDEEEVLE